MHTTKTMGVDAGFETSKFALVVTEEVDGKARVTYSQRFDKPLHDVMVAIARNLMISQNIDKVYVDASNVSFIRALKMRI